MRRIAILIVLIVFGPFVAEAALPHDFSYSYGDPYSDEADDYIVSTSNAELSTEGNFRFWKPIVGGTSMPGTDPAVITYHFEFSEPVGEAQLFMRTDTFHWSYSQGYTFIYGSVDGVDWVLLKETEPPESGEWNPGNFSGLLPDDPFLGATDIWLKAELYSYGSSAPAGGVYTNTAEHSRYDVTRDNTTFSLQVNFIPEPTTLGLLGLALVLGVKRLRRR